MKIKWLTYPLVLIILFFTWSGKSTRRSIYLDLQRERGRTMRTIAWAQDIEHYMVAQKIKEEKKAHYFYLIEKNPTYWNWVQFGQKFDTIFKIDSLDFKFKVIIYNFTQDRNQ